LARPAEEAAQLKMDDNDIDLDSPGAIAAMRRRQVETARWMQAIAMRGLAELEARAKAGKLRLDECEELLAAGLKLESEADSEKKVN
jgi:hypothetical protein